MQSVSDAMPNLNSRIILRKHYNLEFLDLTGEVMQIHADGFTVRLDVGGFARVVIGRDTWEIL